MKAMQRSDWRTAAAKKSVMKGGIWASAGTRTARTFFCPSQNAASACHVKKTSGLAVQLI